MKFSTIATLLFAIGTSAAPEPDNAVIKEGEYTYTATADSARPRGSLRLLPLLLAPRRLLSRKVPVCG
ncbi:hypothetical protein NM208_g8510 [Fusarium decemcellulare]|uniref:Uncharacterized protein n=1 Tax=Fusarium decemcellulare TaxID=57161 RepID=A0ACC1S584_9HYPO|nr:hypothetical protein NM208_g8510 [Fusarium decemcellulare]